MKRNGPRKELRDPGRYALLMYRSGPDGDDDGHGQAEEAPPHVMPSN